MADYFTHFSCEFPVGSIENAAYVMALFERLGPDLDADGDCLEFEASLQDCEPGVVWFHDGGPGNTNQLIDFVQRCAAQLGLTGRWGFTWSRSCTRPVLHAFSGGGGVIDLATREIVAEIGLRHWLDDHLKVGGEHG